MVLQLFWSPDGAGHIGDERLPDFNLSAFIAQPLEGAGDNDADYPRFVVQVGITF